MQKFNEYYDDRKQTNRRHAKVGEGMFPMEFICSLEKMSLVDAKNAAIEKAENSDATLDNILYAKSEIESCFTMFNLLKKLTNFNLSHAGYAVIK